MRYDDGIALLDLHLQRLQRSAKSLGFCYCDGIEEHLRSLRFSIPHKIRLKLSRNGSFVLENSPITPIVCDKIEIAKRIGGGDLIAHKTTLRPYYADVAARIARCEVFDVVFCDEEGRLLEGSRSNVYLEIDGKLLTPKSHILPGVYRQHLIEQGRVQEEELWVCDLQRAERVFCSNAVCGLLEVVRVGGDPKDFLFELA
ncbi:aminotransferase class IV [Helicobacter enhydrae]